MSNVTVILSGYRRLYALKQQYDAIKNQSVQNIKIILWTNRCDNQHIDKEILNNTETIISNANYGVWGRFAIGLLCSTEYVCIMDDDTIPGSRWIESCLTTIEKHDGILTTRGVIANKGKDHMYPLPGSYEAHGWCNPNEETLRVDMGCHCWFFNKNILKAFWIDAPNLTPMNYGEDMHLSYAAQKYFNLYTYIPPHPASNKELWGSLPDTAIKYGTDKAAISWNGHANMGMNQYWNFIRQNGYKIISDD